MKRYIYILLLIFTSASCEMRFELDIPREDSKLFAFCVPGAQDSTAIIIRPAIFAGDSIEFDPSKVEIELCINGERQNVLYQHKYNFPYFSGDHSVPEEVFYITEPVYADDVVTLNVSYTGLESISALTVIPEKPKDPVFSIDTYEYHRPLFTLEYTDSSEDSYYAVVFREKEHFFSTWGYIEENGDIIRDTTEYVTWNHIGSGYEYDPFQSSTEFNYSMSSNNNGVYFWKNSDAQDKDGRKSVFYELYRKHDVVNVYNELNMSYIDYSYEAAFYRINEDLYKYYNTLMLSGNNSLANVGMARINSIFSNIHGGFGILGGMAGEILTFDIDVAESEKYLPEVY